jgi:hypothetical protein
MQVVRVSIQTNLRHIEHASLVSGVEMQPSKPRHVSRGSISSMTSRSLLSKFAASASSLAEDVADLPVQRSWRRVWRIEPGRRARDRPDVGAHMPEWRRHGQRRHDMTGQPGPASGHQGSEQRMLLGRALVHEHHENA